MRKERSRYKTTAGSNKPRPRYGTDKVCVLPRNVCDCCDVTTRNKGAFAAAAYKEACNLWQKGARSMSQRAR